MSKEEVARTTSQGADAGLARASWYTAAVLCLTNVVAFVDRTTLPLLVQQIEADLRISDTQMSLLVGLAFIIAYSSAGLVAGALVDRFSRRALLATGVCVWAAATVASGFVGSFAGLFAARLLVGAGESITGPSAMSIARDRYPPEQRSRAIAIWAMGANLGGGVALLTGGAVLRLVGDGPSVVLPLLGEIRSWQLVLICAGLLALPAALIVLTLREPARVRAAVAAGPRMGAWAAFATNWPVFLVLFVVNGTTIMLTTGFQIWMPAVLQRVWHVSRPEIGLKLGLIALLLGPLSQFLAGAAMDRWGKGAGIRRLCVIGLLVSLAALPLSFLAPVASSVDLLWLLAAGFVLIATAMFTVGTVAITRMAPAGSVGQVTSFHFAWVGIAGTAIAPTLVATVSDRVFAGPGAIANALSATNLGLNTVATLGFASLVALTGRQAVAGLRAAPAR